MTGLIWLTLLVIVAASYHAGESSSYDSIYKFISGCVFYIAAVVLVIALIAWPISWYGDKEFGVEYKAMKETIESVRKASGTDLERAALTHKVIEINRELAVKKYWNDGIWDWYTPDDVANLEPLH